MVSLSYNKNSKGEKQAKKLTVLVLGFGMLFSMATCFGSRVNDDTLDKLESSVKKFNGAKNMNYSTDMDMVVDKENAETKLYGGLISETERPLQLSAIMDVEASGRKLERCMQLLAKGGTIYLNMMDMMKRETSLRDAMGVASTPNVSFDADTFEVNKEDMKEFLKEASVKGSNLKPSFDTEKLGEKTRKEMEKSNITGANVRFKGPDVGATLNNDFMEKTVVTMEVTDTKGETKQEISGTTSLIVEDTSKVSSIDFPDFKDHKEGSIE